MREAEHQKGILHSSKFVPIVVGRKSVPKTGTQPWDPKLGLPNVDPKRAPCSKGLKGPKGRPNLARRACTCSGCRCGCTERTFSTNDRTLGTELDVVTCGHMHYRAGALAKHSLCYIQCSKTLQTPYIIYQKDTICHSKSLAPI